MWVGFSDFWLRMMTETLALEASWKKDLGGVGRIADFLRIGFCKNFLFLDSLH